MPRKPKITANRRAPAQKPAAPKPPSLDKRLDAIERHLLSVANAQEQIALQAALQTDELRGLKAMASPVAYAIDTGPIDLGDLQPSGHVVAVPPGPGFWARLRARLGGRAARAAS